MQGKKNHISLLYMHTQRYFRSIFRPDPIGVFLFFFKLSDLRTANSIRFDFFLHDAEKKSYKNKFLIWKWRNRGQLHICSVT